ncbi:MAG: FAD-dependent oxidoreductase [Crocinitomicaceae bacterium]|nr:FAD-dependent oxidoreductase [Crocinitomicaceae bacterium]
MKKHLIIGGGLAGVTLAWQLIKKGQGVLLIDNKQNKSSSIAAGMINPIVFRRVTKSWRVDEFIPKAKDFYREVEAATGSQFFDSIKIRRFFSSEQEKQSWHQKQEEETYTNYLSLEESYKHEFTSPINNLGSAIVKNAFRVNAKDFMRQTHNLFQTNNSLNYESFDHAQFNLDTMVYNGKKYNSVVFCCGSDQDSIPYFNSVQIQHTKGQVLTITAKQMTEEETWNKKGFILPIGSNSFKVGATIERNTNDTRITKEGRNELLKVINGLYSGNHEITDQVAGIRPTVYDRRPVMGEHPKYKGLYIFNGLGTKGYLMAPLLAQEMADFMVEGRELHEEVQLSRFYKNK